MAVSIVLGTFVILAIGLCIVLSKECYQSSQAGTDTNSNTICINNQSNRTIKPHNQKSNNNNQSNDKRCSIQLNLNPNLNLNAKLNQGNSKKCQNINTNNANNINNNSAKANVVVNNRLSSSKICYNNHHHIVVIVDVVDDMMDDVDDGFVGCGDIDTNDTNDTDNANDNDNDVDRIAYHTNRAAVAADVAAADANDVAIVA